MPSGGYRKPEKPAAVSGPGKYSARTDGKPGTQPVRALPDAGYGEQAEFTGLQQQAPLADSQGVQSAPPQSAARASSVPVPVPFTEPSQRPDEPVTAGIPAGEGPGPEALAPPGPTSVDVARLAQWLPLLEPHARTTDSSPQFRQLVTMIQNLNTRQQINEVPRG